MMRYALYVLLSLCYFQAIATAAVDPFNTDSMLPSRQAPNLEGRSSTPCFLQTPDRPLNLNEVVDLALCNNPQTRELWANSKFYAAQLGIRKAAYLPSADLNASASRNQSGFGSGNNQSNLGLSLSYLLYDFGARSANLELVQQQFAAARASQDSTVQAVFLAAIQAFYRVQASTAALDAALESERAARESYAAAEARFSAGSATRADKLQAQTAYSQTTLNHITAEGNLKNAQGNLANILGLDANRNVSLTAVNLSAIPASFEGDIAALIEQARLHRPDLQAAAAQLKSAQASADAARAADMPTLTLGASASQNSISGNSTDSSSIGINLNVPIFSGFAPTYRIRAAEAQLENRAAQLERLRLQVALDVWTSYQNLVTSTQSLRTTTDLLESAEQSERVALGRYKAGVGNMLDVLNAQSTLASARQQRIQSAFNWNTNRAILAQSMGNLDANLLQTLPSDQSVPTMRGNKSP